MGIFNIKGINYSKLEYVKKYGFKMMSGETVRNLKGVVKGVRSQDGCYCGATPIILLQAIHCIARPENYKFREHLLILLSPFLRRESLEHLFERG